MKRKWMALLFFSSILLALVNPIQGPLNEAIFQTYIHIGAG
ncbi:hypothetical protein [Paenibacillus macerans]